MSTLAERLARLSRVADEFNEKYASEIRAVIIPRVTLRERIEKEWETGGDATVADMADRLGCSRGTAYQYVRQALHAGRIQRLPPPKDAGRKQERNLEIVKLVHAGHSFADVGRRYKISRQRIREIYLIMTET